MPAEEEYPLIFYGPSERCLWWFEFLLKLLTFFGISLTLTSICIPIIKCLFVLIPEWPFLGSFLLITWILWIPVIGFLCYSLGTKKWKFLWPYIIYSFIFHIINSIFSAIALLSLFYPSIKESMSNPKVQGISDDFQKMSFLWPCIMLCCYWWLEAVKLYREKYFL